MNRYYRHIWLLVVTILLLISATNVHANRQRLVTWVADGDTLQVQAIGLVRLIGIDCPEKKESDRDWKYLNMGCKNRKTLRDNAQSTLKRVIKLCKGKQVRLQFGNNKRDRYGRTLAYVWLPDGRMLNRIILEEGRGLVYRRFDFSYKKNFIQLEKSALKRQVGIWHGLRMKKYRKR
ncbi:MAG: thermonuclease family protein [Thermodesulfobacteriota bacterium]|nr:thermonuclease family protein [Thermodesulfobacteriota bacterium]